MNGVFHLKNFRQVGTLSLKTLSSQWCTFMKRVPLNRGDKPLRRTAWMSQQGTTRENHPERAPVKRSGSRRVDTGPSAAVRALVAERDGGRCVICGGVGTNIHHRRNRGSGGSKHPWINSPANLMVCCGSGTTGCHGMITNPAGSGRTLLEMQSLGYCISTNGIVDPADVAVCGIDGWFVLTHEGERLPVPNVEFSETDHETG